MTNPTTPRRSEQSAPISAKRPKLDAATETLVERLINARTVNEMSSIVGLKPIKGRSAPKIAY